MERLVLIKGLLFALAQHVPYPALGVDEGLENVGLKCVAMVVYHEARSAKEPFWGKVAVAQVLVEWSVGSDLCTVAFSGKFSGLKEMPYPREPWKSEPEAWRQAMWIAELVVVYGLRNPECPGVRYFHAVWVDPGWDNWVCTEGGHLFYR